LSFFNYYKLNFEFIYLKKYYKDKFKNYIYISGNESNN